MTTLLDFQKYASENQREADFQTLCDMMGGISKVFNGYFSYDMDLQLLELVLAEAPSPLSAYILAGVIRRLENIEDILKDIKVSVEILHPSNTP
jgi:hypothetical protein